MNKIISQHPRKPCLPSQSYRQIAKARLHTFVITRSCNIYNMIILMWFGHQPSISFIGCIPMLPSTYCLFTRTQLFPVPIYGNYCPSALTHGTGKHQVDKAILYDLHIITMRYLSWYNFDTWYMRHLWANRGGYDKFS